MNLMEKVASKTPFLQFLTRKADKSTKPSMKLTPPDLGAETVPAMIKGNINAKGEKIYHVPEGRFYDKVKPVEMFASIEEAEASGYRKSRQ